MKKMKKMNIYGPTIPHANALIVGNYKAIEALRDACQNALAEVNAGITSDDYRTNKDSLANLRTITHFDGEGEEMNTRVRILTDEQMTNIPIPYIDSDMFPIVDDQVVTPFPFIQELYKEE